MKMKNAAVVCLAWCGVCVSATTAWAAETYEASGTTLSVKQDGEEIATLEVPCTIEGELVRADVPRPVVLAKCGDVDGLLVVDVTTPANPTPLEIRVVEGGLKRVFLVGGKPWVQSKTGAAKAFDMKLALAQVDGPPVEPPIEPPVRPPVEPPVGVSPPVEPPPSDEIVEEIEEIPDGEVLEVEGREAVISVGKDEGVREGLVVRFYEKGSLEKDVPNNDAIATGIVEAVAEGRSTVRLGLNTRVPRGAVARTSRQFYGKETPPRVAGVSEYILNLRPGVPLGALGVFMVNDATFVHRFEAPVAVEVGLSPLGFGLTTEGNALSVAGHAIVSFDHQLFQIGLGGGVSRMAAMPGAPFDVERAEDVPVAGAAPMLLLYARLGSRDALNFTLRTSLLGLETGFELGGFDAQIMAPVPSLIDDAWLVARGSFQTTGYGYGELGLRMLLSGTGHKDSFYVTPLVGGAALFQTTYVAAESFRGEAVFERRDTTLGGPMVGVSFEWRQ